MVNKVDSSIVGSPLELSREITTQLAQKTAPWSCVLWDLDGTITDSAPGIMKRISEAVVKVGLPQPTEEVLFALIGPPLRDSFIHTLGMTEARADEALLIQREIAHREGPGAGSAVYPGVPEMLRELHEAGMPVALATSKGEQQAVEILDFFDIAQYFTVVTGASPDETRSAKADVVEETLRRLEAEGVDISNPVMVGDRIFDINGAGVHGIPTIIVEWGYGSDKETAAAIGHVASHEELRASLLGES